MRPGSGLRHQAACPWEDTELEALRAKVAASPLMPAVLDAQSVSPELSKTAFHGPYVVLPDDGALTVPPARVSLSAGMTVRRCVAEDAKIVAKVVPGLYPPADRMLMVGALDITKLALKAHMKQLSLQRAQDQQLLYERVQLNRAGMALIEDNFTKREEVLRAHATEEQHRARAVRPRTTGSVAPTHCTHHFRQLVNSGRAHPQFCKPSSLFAMRAYAMNLAEPARRDPLPFGSPLIPATPRTAPRSSSSITSRPRCISSAPMASSPLLERHVAA
eukprot:CAMPEP_0205860986 /NCGR_PEP_ID=MMETSP1083-20121108/5520_1 /ASSEMBLY_ACC=CAM_ASM_000430 /TAXON_ID=97485 /ORGANISM="Prymnesium parvum, Strain Texoma1" /LENGTH=274 /DNA_ID=CAMNT_0053222643 /DNA_START=35 /DNA_END=859 /DNA_ORIENTATION=+